MRTAKGFSHRGLLADYAAMSSGNPQASIGSATNPQQAVVSHNPGVEVPLKPQPKPQQQPAAGPAEIGGRDGPEPTRFGDWEKRGRCIDF